jgi:MSHA type pilus biogenesis protein MshL
MLGKKGLALACLCFHLAGCDEIKRIDEHDPELKYTKKEYVEMLTAQGEYANAPPLAPRYFPPKSADKVPSEMRAPVSISVTNQLPLHDVFMELARQAKINISLSPKVEGGVFFQAHKQPAIDVIAEICHMSGMRYTVENKTVRIEPDVPYMKSYNLQFLALSREKKNRISMTTDVFTAIEGSVRDFDNGSSTLLTGDSKVDFWDEFEGNIGHILNPSEDGEGGTYTAHRQAGIVTVTGTQDQHKQVRQFIKDLLYSSQLQVVIEAKIVEVNLNDEYESGINWHSLKDQFVLNAPLGNLARPGPFEVAARPLRDVFTIGRRGDSLTALASFLSKFGTVRTLSSPRVTVLNNQTSVLKVATNRVFFKVNYYRDIPTDDNPGYERASSQIQTVPIGLVMVVQPSIDVETGRITMTLRPTISRIIGEKEDPAVAILSNNTQRSTVPEVQVRELDSVLQMESGDTVVMGGLMEDRSDDEHSGVPVMKDVPWVGNLFGGKHQNRQVSELVIFLRATVQQVPVIDEADQRVYEKFTHDPRPLAF